MAPPMFVGTSCCTELFDCKPEGKTYNFIKVRKKALAVKFKGKEPIMQVMEKCLQMFVERIEEFALVVEQYNEWLQIL